MATMDPKTSPLAQLKDPSLLKTDALINGEWVGGAVTAMSTPCQRPRLL